MGATLGELRANMNCLKGKIWSQMELMEADLVKVPFPEFSLRRKLENVETDWNKAENYYDHFYDHILTLTEDDCLAYEEFQTRYLDLNGQVEDALEEHRLEEEARE